MHLRSCVIILLLLFLLSGIASASDADEIEDLCKNGGTVNLESRTYIIDRSFSLPSNIELVGQDNTCLQLASNCGIPQNVPMISIINQKNVTIKNIKFDGKQDTQKYALSISNSNHPEQTGKKAYGNQVNTFIYAINGENIKVTGCNGYDNLGDFLRCSGCKGVEFSYNSASMGGHDVFFALRSSVIKVHHNNIKTLVNAAVRLLDCNHARVYNNKISWEGPRDAGPAIQIQHDKNKMGDIEICGNKILSSCGPGLWLVGKTSGGEDLWLHHNLFQNCGDNKISWVGGIIASGYDNAKIENNVFDGCYRGGVVFFAVNKAWATDAHATLSKNIFANSKAGQLDGKGPYGVENDISKQDVQLSQNCFYNNKAGNVEGCKLSDSDIFVNPKDEDTPSGWSWESGQWICKEVSPSEMEGIPDEFTPLTEKEIEDADEAAREFEFNDIFDVLAIDFVEKANKNSAVILPDGVNANYHNVTATVTYYPNQTLVSVAPAEGLTSIHVIADNTESIHTLMFGEKLGTSTVYNNVSVWQGEHIGNSFYFSGNPENIQVICETPKDSFKPTISSEYIEQQKGIFNIWVLVYIFIITVFLSVFFLVLWIVLK